MELHGQSVYVMSVSSVENFYVIREKDLEKLEALQREINSPESLDRLREELEGEVPVINVGSKVLARYHADRQLHRAEILALDEESGKVGVLYSDFGNQDDVEAGNLYPLPYNLRMIENYAIRCCLSCSSGQREEESTKEFIESLSSSRPMSLQVFSVRKDCLEVDLVKISEDDDEHLSIRDFLVFLGKAYFAPPWSDQKFPNVYDQSLEGHQLDFQVGDIHKGKVSYVPFIHPGGWLELSVVVTSAVPAYRLPRLMAKMRRTYEFPRSEWLWGVEEVVFPGMICAAKDDQDGQWYRCQVIANVRGRIYSVRYLDFGDTKNLVVYRLRRLFPRFIDHYPVMAKSLHIPVRIDTVAQAHQVNKFLRGYLMNMEVGFQVAKVLHDKVMVDMDYEGVEIKEIVKILKNNC